jgi:hypothetical protein
MIVSSSMFDVNAKLELDAFNVQRVDESKERGESSSTIVSAI